MAPIVVEVSLGAAGVRIARPDGTLLRQWPRTGLECDAMQAGVLHVSHADAPQETLVVHDKNLCARLLELSPPRQVLPGGQQKLAFALACLLGVVILGAGFYFATPTLARLVAHKVPLEQEKALGGQLEPFLKLSRCSGGSAREPLQKLLAKLGAAGFEVQVIQGSGPNAFALPGGSVIVTHGLLREAESVDEVAGVLAHEVEHVTQRHVLAGLIRDAIFTGIWSITVGDYAGLLVLDPGTAYRIANLEFSRDDEAAADRGAVRRLHAAGIGHDGLIRFFERLEARYRGKEGPEWMSTHPSTRARIEILRSMPALAQPAAPLTPEEAAQLRKGCD